MPDLSSLHFPPPLPTPLDQDEPPYPGPSALSGGSSTGSLASTLTQLGITAAGPPGGGFLASQGGCVGVGVGVGGFLLTSCPRLQVCSCPSTTLSPTTLCIRR